MSLDVFDFDLPRELIAQFPSSERGASRLLYVDLVNDHLRDGRFGDLPGLLESGDLLVFNDTRVIKARLYGRKASGGKLEILVERVVAANQVLAQVRASHALRAGDEFALLSGTPVHVVERHDSFFLLEFGGDTAVLDLLERSGEVPLPPYIDRAPSAADAQRYQTIYARVPGAVAAPTAGLHFDQPMLDRLQALGVELAYVTLHVGAGTFQPVRATQLKDHRMHSEWYRIPDATTVAIQRARARGGRVVAVGTTTLRALESAAVDGELRAGSAETQLFIRPGFRFAAVDRLVTNFHLPRSTLLMLVCAFAGTQTVLRAYRHAVAERYRFFSYGDAMLLDCLARQDRPCALAT